MFSQYEDLPRGAVRDTHSKALKFPVDPQWYEDQKNRKKLKDELAEVEALKNQLQEMMEKLTDNKD